MAQTVDFDGAFNAILRKKQAKAKRAERDTSTVDTASLQDSDVVPSTFSERRRYQLYIWSRKRKQRSAGTPR